MKLNFSTNSNRPGVEYKFMRNRPRSSFKALINLKHYFSEPPFKKVKWSEVAQLCPTLCDPMDCSLPGSSIHGIFQAGVLAWVAISFSRGSSQTRDQTRSHTLQADTLPSEPPGKPLYHLSLSLSICKMESLTSKGNFRLLSPLPSS